MATTFEYKDKSYELHMTRAGVREAENQGLRTSEITEKPFTALVGLFFAALFSKYRLAPNQAATMLDDLLDSGVLKFEDIFAELAEEYGALFS